VALAPLENRISLVGTVVDAPDTRYSPAGVRITRLLLAHESSQEEAGQRRSIRFRIGVRAAGDGAGETAASLGAGERIRVEGFLARLRQDPEDNRLVVSADRIERLEGMQTTH
jgi:primosomal replication protein N